MKNIFENYECENQISIFEYLEEKEKRHMVDIKGLCDDAFCPNCGYWFDELKEKDCDCCPKCGILVDWKRWHDCND